MVGQLVEEGGDRGGVWEDGVPGAEGEVCGDQDGAAGQIPWTGPLVASVDDLVEQVGGVRVVGEVADLVDREQVGPGVAAESASQCLGAAGAQVLDEFGGSGAQDGEAGEDRLVGDVPGDHGLAQAVRADEGEVAALADEVEAERTLDQVALDLLWPVPVEVGDGLEASDAGPLQPALEAASRSLDLLQPCDLLQDLSGRPAALGGAGQKVVEGLGDRQQAHLAQPGDQVSRVRHRLPRRVPSEFIVGLRAVGFDVDVAQIRAAGQLDGQGHSSLGRAAAPGEQEGDRAEPRGLPSEGLGYRGRELGRAVVVEQEQQTLGGGGDGLAALEARLEQRLGSRDGVVEPGPGQRAARPPLLLEQRVDVGGVLDRWWRS